MKVNCKWYKLVALLVTVSMCVAILQVLIPKKTIFATSIKNQSNTSLGTSVIANPIAPSSNSKAWQGSYVYFGIYNDQAIKFRVLSNYETKFGSPSLFLDSDKLLFTSAYHKNTVNYTAMKWVNTTLNQNLNSTFLENSFSLLESDALVECVSSDLNGQKVILLSAPEVHDSKYGYYNNSYGTNHTKYYGNSSKRWWLRTISSTSRYANYETTYLNYPAACATKVNDTNGNSLITVCGVAPAINISQSSIVFSTLVSGSLGEIGAEYKLTISDDNLYISIPLNEEISMGGSTVSVPYQITGDNADNATRVSVLILDREYTVGNTNNANVILYESLDGNFAKSGSGMFNLPETLDIAGWGIDYYVYILAEDINDVYQTDYASEPTQIDAPTNSLVSYNVGVNNGSADVATTVEGKKVTITAGEAPEGMVFDRWVIDAPADLTINEEYLKTTSFTMPACDVQVKATYKPCVDYGICGDNLTWILDDSGTLTIKGNGDMYDWEDDSVPWVNYRNRIKAIEFDGNVTSIGRYAFARCPYLTSVDIPDTVKSIGQWAFTWDYALSNVTIPDGVTTIGWDAFRECKSLTNVMIPDSVTSIGDCAFLWCDNLAEVTLSNNLTYIDNETFRGCYSLAEITIPESVTGIGNKAFQDCTSLTSVVFPDSEISIGDEAFDNCPKLVFVAINEKSYSEDAFPSVPAEVMHYYYSVSVNFGTTDVTSAFDGSTVTVTADEAPTGKAFYMWVSDSDAVEFDNADSDTATFTMPAEDVEITATYKDAYMLSVSSGMTEETQVAEGKTVTITAEEAPEGKEFDKWEVVSGNVLLGDATSPTTSFVMPTEEVVIIAIYVDVNYDITINSGTADKTAATMGKSITITANLAPVGQTFDKWEVVQPSALTLVNPASSTTSFIMPSASVEIKALYKDLTYTVSYDMKGYGSAPTTQNVTYGNKATKPADPTATGYTFGGWYTNSACTTAYDYNTAVTADITLYAKWTAVSTTPAPTTPATPEPATPAPSTPAPEPEPEPEPMETPVLTTGIAHVQDIGDVSYTTEAGVLTIGTRGMGKRLEEITINFENTTGLSGTLEYRVHVQDYGWMEWVPAGTKCGTEGEAKRIEAIEIRFTGELADYYSVEYCVHIQDYGDMQGWVKDGALAGTTGESKRIEELKIRIVPKNSGPSMSVKYRVHVQDYGWEGAYASNGQMSGTSGESKRLEGIEIFLDGNQYSGGVKFKTHVQDYGWQGWSYDGEMSGTQGEAKRLEGICIELYGEIADYYDIYYRVHAQDIGWMAWAKNGECAGTAGRSARLEGIQIVLVPKGSPAPGATYEGITAVTDKAFIEGF